MNSAGIRPDTAFAVLLGCFVLLWLSAGLVLFDYPMLVIRFPASVGLFTVTMCIAIAVTGLRAGAASSRPIPAGAGFDRRKLIRVLGLSSILPIAYVMGYVLGLPVFLAVYLAINGLSWPRCLLAAVSCGLLIEVVFVRLMQVALPMPWGF